MRCKSFLKRRAGKKMDFFVFFLSVMFFIPTLAFSQSNIKGTVTDSDNNPLENVSVMIKNTTRGTTTNSAGVFNISASSKDILVFSSTGYQTVELTVGSQTNIHATLQLESTTLEEVVVGFGTQQKVNLTGAISQISGKEIENRPVANIGQALQGVVPNLNVTIGNGSPNTTPSLNVRGGTSFNSGGILMGSPYTLVDGVPMNISQINPQDIESITVLKDAASSAIYGARAAYGVMLITTKKGRKNEKPSVTYYNDFQWNRPAAIPDLLNAEEIQQALMDAQALVNGSVTTDMTVKMQAIQAYMADPEHAPAYYMSVPGNDASSIIWVANQNPFKEAVSNSAPMQKHNLSVTGGTDKSTYYLSLGYLAQDGLYKINTDKFKRYNVAFNLSSEVSNWFKVDFKASYYNTLYTQPVNPGGKGGWWRALSQEPGRNINMPIVVPEGAPYDRAGYYTDNILSFMSYGSLDRQNTENLVFAISPTIKLTKNWNVKSDISFTSQTANEKEIIPLLNRIENSWLTTTAVYTSPSSVDKFINHFNQYLINLYSDYTLKLGNHNIYGLVGFNQEWYKADYLEGVGNDMITPAVPVINQTTGQRQAFDGESDWAVRGAFYRVTYNYKGKYLLESNGRYDLTSRFPSYSRAKFFPSVSAGWRISEEKFFQPLGNTITNLKLRASYGSIGNQNVANYIYIPSYGTTSQVQQLFNGVRPLGITPPGLVDPNITWETASTLDFGIDLSFIHKLDVEFDWYRRTTTDILVAGDKFPAVLGAAAPQKNSGSLKTNGWEITAKWRDKIKNTVNYDLTFVLSDYQTMITKFDGNPTNLLSTFYVGQKMGEIWGFVTEGLFQTKDDITNAPKQTQIYSGTYYPGDVQYKDLNGDTLITRGAGTLSDPGDRKIIGNSTPRLSYGFTANFSWKGLDLNLFFQGVGKRDVWVSDNLFWGAIAGGIGTKEVYKNSWTPENPNALYPGYRSASYNLQVQTRYLQNAAYLRLKNITLGYSLPNHIIQKARISKARFYLAGYNIWQSSKVPQVFDPEVLSANYPMIKSYSFGLQVTL